MNMRSKHRTLRTAARIMTALSLGLLGSAIIGSAEAQTTAAIYFEGSLSPYGRWVDDPNYGRVWIPRDAGRDWRPYTYGRWVYTSDYGWVWVSEEPWGWIAYHYGRWVWTAQYGWVWLPGDEWAPAWVDWCYGAGYVGWAPMPPDAYWQGVYYHGAYTCASPQYYSRAVYVQESSFMSARISAHVVSPTQNAAIARGTLNITNYSRDGRGITNRSVDIHKVQAATGVAIKPLRTIQAKAPVASAAALGANHELRIYRPTLDLATELNPPLADRQLKLKTDPSTLPPLETGTLRRPDDLGASNVPPSTRLDTPPLDGPSLAGPSMGGNPIGGALGGVRGRLGR
jgi:hypothetical protein